MISSCAFALDLSTLEPQGYLSDFAGVVDGESKQSIELYSARLQKATGAQIAIVTLQSLDGQPIEDVANDLFRRWGVGQKGEDNGLLFLLVVGERRTRLEVGRGLEPFITDGRAGATLRDMRPALREGRYGEALQIAATSLGQVIAQAKGVEVDTGAARPIRRAPPSQPVYDGIPWHLIVGGIFLLLMLLGKGGGGRGRHGGGGMGGLLPGLILGNMMSGRSYGGGYGGGGFGGYDSGDTFGGFGGGDSGGGGASSDW
ncbi:MAG TPA: TPM domain-containing protein [Bryobacteraceae bacterium]|nr:TPM domain-containing protein [Bryobacteraceae bacterium]